MSNKRSDQESASNSSGTSQFILRIVKGAMVGVGAILPGISGGVLSVVFGIYRPLMEFLAHPISQFKQKFAFFLPIVIGFALGVLGLARVVDWLFRESPVASVWLFSGLVVGTLPALFHEAGQQGRSRGSWVAMALAAALTGAWMISMNSLDSTSGQVTPNIWWWLVCGALWGVGLIVPGMSPSSIFIFLGLYQPMTAGIAALDLGIVLPLMVGLLATVALLARGMGWLLNRFYSTVLHAIFGIVLASTVGILPIGQGVQDAAHIALYVGCFLFGASVAYAMERMHTIMEERGELD